MLYDENKRSGKKENVSQTTTTPPSDLLKIMILNRRDDALLSIESYYKYLFQDVIPPSHIVRSRVISLFFDLEAYFYRVLDTDKYKKLQEKIFSNDVNIVIKAFRELNQKMDELNLIRFDTKTKIDITRVESENMEKSL